MTKFKNQVHKKKLAKQSFLKKVATSHFNYYFGYVSNVSIVIWLCSQAFENGTSLLNWIEWIYIPAIGLFGWTLIEYLMHKYAYHVWKSPFEKGHMMHHDRPYDLMGIPWYIILIFVIGVFYGLAQLISPVHLAVYMAFIWLGYIGYCITHHAIHHWKINHKLFKKLKRHHYIHHARSDKNIGIVTTFWDVVLGTIEKK